MIAVEKMRVEYLDSPLGMDVFSPRFTWLAAADAAGFELQDKAGKLIFSYSGSVTSPFVCPGLELEPCREYRWRIVFAADFGPYAEFETGLLNLPWDSEWIADPGVSGFVPVGVSRFRKSFRVSGTTTSARLRVTALGIYTAALNGRRVGDMLLTPGWTDYYYRTQYQTYDVSGLVQTGDNLLELDLAGGWYDGRISSASADAIACYGANPALSARLEIIQAGGKKLRIDTGKDWECANDGPVVSSDIYNGECIDLGRSYHDFHPAVVSPRNVNVTGTAAPGVKEIEIRKPAAVTRNSPDTILVDFGQNLSGRERLFVPAAPGRKITVLHGEVLSPDGRLYTENLRSARAATEIIAGEQPALCEAGFTFYGFRYLEILNYPGEPDPEMVSAAVMHSDLEQTGRFTCSNPLLNRLFSNIIWGQRDNFVDIPTDCPQRDERLGWLGDAQVFMPAACYNMFVPAFFTRWLRDVTLGQNANGEYPPYAPYRPHWRGFVGGSGWSDAGIICPYWLYLFYGDSRVIEEHYPDMSKWIEFQRRTSSGNLRIVDKYRDWLNVDADTPPDLICTAYFAFGAKKLSEMSAAIGRDAEAAELLALSNEVAAAFWRRFGSADGTLTVNTQTAAALALYMGLVPAEHTSAVAGQLVNNIEIERGGHLSTGFLGTPVLLHALSENGALATAYRLLEQTTFPSWLYPVTQGATTVWERWDSFHHERGFNTPTMNSFNHYAYGAVADWMYGVVCGIKPLLETPGFSMFTLAPQPGGTLTGARAEYDSIRGRIVSGWSRKNGEIRYEFEVPRGCRAKLKLPGEPETVIGSGHSEFKRHATENAVEKTTV